MHGWLDTIAVLHYCCVTFFVKEQLFTREKEKKRILLFPFKYSNTSFPEGYVFLLQKHCYVQYCFIVKNGCDVQLPMVVVSCTQVDMMLVLCKEETYCASFGNGEAVHVIYS